MRRSWGRERRQVRPATAALGCGIVGQGYWIIALVPGNLKIVWTQLYWYTVWDRGFLAPSYILFIRYIDLFIRAFGHVHRRFWVEYSNGTADTAGRQSTYNYNTNWQFILSDFTFQSGCRIARKRDFNQMGLTFLLKQFYDTVVFYIHIMYVCML